VSDEAPAGAGVPIQPVRVSGVKMNVDRQAQRHSAPHTNSRDTAGRSSAAVTLTSLGGFDAIDDTGITPADLDLAVNWTRVVAISNDQIETYDKCGNLLGSTTMSAIAGSGGLPGVYSGGRVIFDQWHDRFALAFIRTDFSSGQGYVHWSFSDDGLSWADYEMDEILIGAGRLADFIDIGADPDNVYLTMNIFNISTFVFEAAGLVIADAASFYDLFTTTFYPRTFGNNPGNGLPASAVRVAKMRSWSGSQYFVNTHPSGGRYLTAWTFTGAPATGVLAATNILGIAYDPNPAVPQPDGTYIAMGDARAYDAAYRGGELLAVSHRSLPPPQIASFIRWSMAATGAVITAVLRVRRECLAAPPFRRLSSISTATNITALSGSTAATVSFPVPRCRWSPRFPTGTTTLSLRRDRPTMPAPGPERPATPIGGATHRGYASTRRASACGCWACTRPTTRFLHGAAVSSW